MFAVYIFEEMRLPIELLSATLVFILPFARKKECFILRAVAGFIVVTLFSLFYFIIFGEDKQNPRFHFLTVFWYLIISLTSPMYSRLCFKISRSDAAFFGGLSFALQNIVYNLYHIYIATICFPWFKTHLFLYILGTFISCGIIFVVAYKIYSPLLQSSDGVLLPDSSKNIITYLIVNIFIYVFLIFYQAVLKQGTSVYDQMSWLLGIMVSILILAVQYSSIAALVYSGKTRLIEEMLRNSEHYYELSKEHIAIINRKCHDLKHQLKILRNVSEEERNNYIDEAEKSIIFYQDLIYTDNEALNTILAEKGLFCRENKIDFHCSVDNSVDMSFIRVSDLYALLGNAIDNAIEYTKQQTDSNLRSISLRIDSKNSFIGIQVSNPLSEADSLKLRKVSISRTIPSTKDDTLNHGYGLKSIRYLTEKYDGSMELSSNGGLFTLQLVFPVKSRL